MYLVYCNFKRKGLKYRVRVFLNMLKKRYTVPLFFRLKYNIKDTNVFKKYSKLQLQDTLDFHNSKLKIKYTIIFLKYISNKCIFDTAQRY